MSVKAEHPDYTAMLDKWTRCRDCASGQDAIYKKQGKYLPRLTEQNDPEYQAYLTRTPFYNATWRTIDGLRGMIFRKPAQLTVPDAMASMMTNVDLSGHPLQLFALDIVEEALMVGRVGIFVDYPEVNVGVVTMADALKMKLQPSLKMYRAEAIINWKTSQIDNANVLSMVVLEECLKRPKDEFEDEDVPQWRVLDLMPYVQDEALKYVYRVRVFEVDEKGNNVLMSTKYPLINGQPLTYIPFQFIGVDDVNSEVDLPPLIDLVDMNLSHFKTTADYEHGCHFTGLPTPVVSGYTPNSEAGESGKFCIGSTTAWVFPNAQAKATFLEFTGQGLGSLEKNLQRKENYMAVLGARMLEGQVKSVESANTASIHRGGEQSTLASIAQTVSIGITQALKFFAAFANVKVDDIKMELNRDFFPIPMDSLTLTAIIAGWMNGAYSYDTMFANLKKGEIVPVEASAEDEQKAVKANPPPVLQVGTTPGSSSRNGTGAASQDGASHVKDPTSTQLQNH